MKAKTDVCIVSPSGKLYGSEQVLKDFLKNSNKDYLVFCPSNSILFDVLRQETNRHIHMVFSNHIMLYFQIFFLLLLKKTRTVYVNEGGHIRYVKLLATLFPKNLFYVHIRIVEDTLKSRLQKLKSNVRLISISHFIQDKLKLEGYDSALIYDLYDSNNGDSASYQFLKPHLHLINVGFIGRITNTKGLPKIQSLIEHVDNYYPNKFHFHFFGEIDSNEQSVLACLNNISTLENVEVTFHGFVKAKEEIYSKINVAVHLSTIEALGRIFFEALDYKTYFIGFNKGGIGEIASTLGLSNYMINDNSAWKEEICSKIINLIDKDDRAVEIYENAVSVMKSKFSTENYVSSLECLLIDNESFVCRSA
ncbi:glycosyltransferase [Pontibacter cellulosilyticus]|uniref:Glycosyltransferase family 4 protein n=1 Tax=Pontibacter cellulosilyticus TaxID=1720253 RepID=A0A923N654_9BACT|nr:glycosyltransferase [Pontibacter cellulosilyticus]MBC5991622.1 glycosyltransferase family 4 protein [Pontibacter cellulosilyticus]